MPPTQGNASVTFITHPSKKNGAKVRDFEPLDGFLGSLPHCRSHFGRHKFLASGIKFLTFS
jgi:hypothetical protein